MALFTDNIPNKAKAYVSVVILLGVAALARSLYVSFTSGDLTWLFIAGITVIGSILPVGIPYAKGQAQSISITASDVFIFASMLLFSPEVAVSIALIDSVLGSFKVKRLYRFIF